jgi:hypothetical protein
MKRTLCAGVASLLVSSVFAQDTVLTPMMEKSDVIAHVKVLEVQGGRYDEAGVEEMVATCEVIELIKGSVKDPKLVSFHFNRFHFQKNEEPSIVSKGNQYVLFLSGDSKDNLSIPPFNLIDRWTGALQYHFHLVSHLKEHLKEKK